MQPRVDLPVDVPLLMRRVNEEVAKRAAGDNVPPTNSMEHADGAALDLSNLSANQKVLSHDAPPPAAVQVTLPVWEPQLDFPEIRAAADGRYVLRDLLSHQDRDFIFVAYSAVLGRAPDPEGFETYLQHLRAGASKVDIVRFLSDSPEGRATGTRVKGLAMATFVEKVGRWPIIGFVVYAIAAIRSREKVERQQRIVNGHFYSQMERTQDASRAAQVMICQAVRDLETGYQDLLAYAVSKPGNQALQRFLAAKLETKTERTEFTDLKKHLFDLVESRLPREELTQLEASLRSKIQYLIDGKVDRSEVESAIKKTIGVATDLHASTVRTVDATIRPIKDSLGILQHSKVDRAVLAVAIAETEANTESALNALSLSLQAVANSKLDQSAVVARDNALLATLSNFREEARIEMRDAVGMLSDTFRELARLKDNQAKLEAGLAESRASSQEALSVWKQSTKSAIDGKADHASVDAALARIKEALDDVRKETQLRIDSAEAATYILRDTLHSLATSKSDHDSLEAVKAEQKSELEQVVVRSNLQIRDIKRNLLDQERRLRLLLAEARKRLPEPISVIQIQSMLREEDHLLDAMYASFEDIFRGTREDIMQRQAVYLPYMSDAHAGTPSAPIIDIGCGRGEWLEVLRREGLAGRGVDINRVFLNDCRELDLDVTEMDGVAFLSSLPTNSAGAVTSFHLVEHLDQKTLLALFDAAFDSLKPGGIAIFETPNPRNVRVGSCTFYLDPTHRNPLPPELLKFLLEARGFVDVQIKELHPSLIEERLTTGDPSVNEVLDRFFFSAQDYAVIGKKA